MQGKRPQLDEEYRAETCFIIKYSGHKNDEREKNISEIRSALDKVGRAEEIEFDEDEPIPLIRNLCERIESLIENKKNSTVTIDITTPIKWHLLIFLKFLNTTGCNVRFVYTEPKDYVTDLFQSLSFGIKEIFPIPTYYGSYDFSKGDFLVLMLGYEGNRAMALYDSIDPSDCLLLVADPPYHPEWKGRTEEMNQEIIGIAGRNKIRYLDSRNPIKVACQLRNILTEEKYSEYNHIISPLGTKPQILGLYAYLSLYSNKTIVQYGAPLRRNDLFYSTGIGKTWELPFKKLDKNTR